MARTVRRLTGVLAALPVVLVLTYPAAARTHGWSGYPPHIGAALEALSAAIGEEKLAIQLLTPANAKPSAAEVQAAKKAIARAEHDVEEALTEIRSAVVAHELPPGTSPQLILNLENALRKDSDADGWLAGTGKYASDSVQVLKEALRLKSLDQLSLEFRKTPTRTPTSPCTVSYPAATGPGESTIGLTGCTLPLTAIGITLPSAVTQVSNYAVESSTGMNTGACSKSGHSLECKLNNPMQSTQIFVVAFGPALKIGEKMVFHLTPKVGPDLTFPVIAPSGPKLKVAGTVKEDTGSGVTPGTSFTITLRIGGGPFQNFYIPVPSGNQAGFASKPSTARLSCGVQRTTGGGMREICSHTPGPDSQTLPAGSYTFGASFQKPLASGAVLDVFVTGTGVAPPTKATLKAP